VDSLELLRYEHGPPATNHKDASWSVLQKAVFGMVAVVLAVLVILATIRLKRSQRQAAALQLSRGPLLDSIKKMARKAGIFVWLDPRV
jgi:ABC-type transport system involved in cytochrome c biogenesis permease subunit